MTAKKPHDRDPKVPTVEELGCEFADLYYASVLGITITEARKKYTCAGSKDGAISNECPFPELSVCILATKKIPGWRQGYATGKLSAIPKSAKLIPFDNNNKTYYECSECKSHRPFMLYPLPDYCWNCGAKFS